MYAAAATSSLLKKSQASARQGASGRKSAVYTPVHEHFSTAGNAVSRRLRLFQQAASRGVLLLAFANALFATALADTTATPAARAEIEKYAGPYPGDRFMDLRAIYKKHLREAGFPAATITRDIEYGPDERHRLDVHQPPGTPGSALPILVFVHGGAFVRGVRSDGEIFDNVLAYFARHGVLGINATYRLAPEHRWPAAVDDLRGVMRWVRDHAEDFGGDTARVFLMGHSAGAVHVASYSFDESRQLNGGDDGLAGAILLSGVYGDERTGEDGHVYFGQNPEDVRTRVPMAQLEGRAVPLFIIDAEYDPLVMQQSALALTGAVCARDGRCPRHQQIPGHNHYSMTYHINTLDDSIAADILDFIADQVREQ